MALLVALCAALWVPAAAQAEVSALFINVGKADSALLFLGERRYLVDTGTKDSYDQLESVLRAFEVTRLDGVILTHTDKDHVGGLNQLLKSDIEVDRVYAGTLHSEKSLEDHPVYETTQKRGAALSWLSAGDELEAGQGCTFWVLGPLTQDNDKENNNSLVLLLTTPEGDMLLTGDMELPEEAELLAAGAFLQVDVLKVAHHGQDDATSEAFVNIVRPQWAVISTSTAEKPSTPDDGVVESLLRAGAGVAVTQDAQVGILITLSGGVATAQSVQWP